MNVVSELSCDLHTIASAEWLLRQLVLASIMGSMVYFIVWCFNFAIKLPLFWVSLLLTLALFRFVCLVTPPSPISALNLITPSIQDAHSHPIPTVTPQTPILLPSPTETPTTEFQVWQNKSAAGWLNPIMLSSGWIYCLLGAWLLGAIVSLFRLFRNWRTTQGLVLRSQPAPESAMTLFEELQNIFGRSSISKIRLRTTSELTSPAITGFFRRTILLPNSCIQTLDRNELICVLTHELTHAQRCDFVRLVFSHIVAALHWFNPIVRLVTHRLTELRELACDRQTLQAIAQHDLILGNSKSVYGSTILKLEQSDSSCPNQQFLPAFSSQQNFNKERILEMLNSSSPNRLLGITACVLACMLIGSAFTMPVEAQKSQNKKHQAQRQAPIQETKSQPQRSRNSQPELPLDATPRRSEVPTRCFEIPLRQSVRYPLPYRVAEIQIQDPEKIKANPVSPTEIEFKALEAGTHEVFLVDGQGIRQKLCVVAAEPRFEIKLNHPTRIKFGKKIAEAQIVSPDGLKVRAIASNELEFKALQPGQHVIFLTDENGAKEKVVLATSKLKPEAKAAESANLQITIQLKQYELELDEWDEALTRHKMLQKLKRDCSIVTNLNDDILKICHDLESKKILKLRNQPVIFAKAGHKFNFLSGGEVPIEIEANGNKKIEFRPFGVMLDGRVKKTDAREALLDISAEITELAKDLMVDGVPGFRTQRLNSSIQTRHKQWNAIRVNDTMILLKTNSTTKN